MTRLHRAWFPSIVVGLLAPTCLAGEAKPEPKAKNVCTVLVYEVVGEPGAKAASGVKVDPTTVDKTVAALHRRLNPGWFRPIGVRKAGTERIEIRVPGNDPERVRRVQRLVESAGTLEFRILANAKTHQAIIDEARKLKGQTQVKDPGGNVLGYWVPVTPKQRKDFADDPEVVTRVRSVDNKERLEVLVVKDECDVDGSYLVRAARNVDQHGDFEVELGFNAAGGNLFGRLTGNHLPDEQRKLRYRLGIILDGHLFSAPTIRSRIFKNAIISGRFTRQEVDDLIDVLNAGILPAMVKKVDGPRVVEE